MTQPGLEPLQVTYCGNVHAAASLGEWIDTLPRFAVPVARGMAVRVTAGGQRSPGVQTVGAGQGVSGKGVFGLGVWWPAAVARVLADDRAAQAHVRAELARHGLAIATINAFPFGDFHQRVVKTAVYRPDWSEAARVEFTLDVARAACALCPSGSQVPISTLPLGFGGGDVRRMRANLAHVAQACAVLAAQTGVTCVLALEPEPFCLLETVAEAIACVEAVCAEHRDEAVLRRHLGVCVDLCHLAVVGEDPIAAWRLLQRAGVTAAKVQVSACLEVRGADGISRLLDYDEARYLHQTIGELASGARLRALDLGEVAARRGEFARAQRIRTHFHVPLFWDEAGSFGSTRAEMTTFLRQLRPPFPLLEAETYTWSVLPGFGGDDAALVAGLVRELTFLSDCLTLAPAKP